MGKGKSGLFSGGKIVVPGEKCAAVQRKKLCTVHEEEDCSVHGGEVSCSLGNLSSSQRELGSSDDDLCCK